MNPHRIKYRPEAPHPLLCPLVTSFLVRFLILDTEEGSRWCDCLCSNFSLCRIEGDFDKDDYELMLVTEL